MKEIELINKRKLREKHFLQEDGTIIAKVYNRNVHYLKDGKYEEIDNSLQKEKNCYRNKSNDYHVFYSSLGNHSLMKMERQEDYVDISLKGVMDSYLDKENLNTETGEVIYTNVLDGVDIKYDTLPTKIKETIILKDNRHEQLEFVIDTNLNLVMIDNKILAKKGDTIIFAIEKPYMEDSASQVNQNIFYELRKVNTSYELILNLDKDWLDSEDRVFPIFVDPTITNMGQEITLSDTYIFPGDDNTIRSTQPILKAGVERVNGTDIVNRSLIKFTLPEIGTGSEIIGAYLTLTGYPVVTSDNEYRTVTMHRITEDWTEENATWDKMNDKYEERVESIYYGLRSYLDLHPPITITPEHGLYDGNITNLVKKWYRDTPNYGILLKSAEEKYVGEQFPAFCSKDYRQEGDSYDPKPVFQLVYRNLNGIESYLDYKVQNFTDGATYVNTFTGNMTGIFQIGHTIGGKLPATVNLVYNTNDAVLNHITKFGRGCKLSLDQTIQVAMIDGKEYLEYQDEDGTSHYFYQDGDIYLDEDGLSLIISKTDSTCIMTDKTGGKMTFTKISDKYRLTEIKDVKENAIMIEFNSAHDISKITDANNAEITFTYGTNEIEIVSPDSIVTLKYSGSYLTSIETPNGVTTFSTNTESIISTIIDVTGLKIQYDYCSQKPYRISKITQYGLNEKIGNFFKLSYGFNTTTITDYKGKTSTIIFNSNGNVLSMNSLGSDETIHDAYSITQNYGNDEANKNKLLSDSIPIKYVNNLLKNTSFETDSDYFTVTSGVTKSFSTDYANSGRRSLKVVSNSTDSQHYIIQTIDGLEKGKHYTFSGYFKTNTNVRISLGYDATNIAESGRFGDESIMPTDEFIRKDVTVYYDEDAQNPLKIFIELSDNGTLYIDDIQLEEGEVANQYNVIENSDFSNGLSDWNLFTWRFDDENAPNTSDVFEVIQINKHQTALKVKMNPLQGSRFSKEFPIKGKKGDLYNLSFWYKNEGIPADGEIVGNSVMIYFKPVGQDADYCILPSGDLHHDENVWQYYTFRYGADEDYESILIVFNQGREANDFYITNLTFFKDLSNNEYEYDDEGNVTKIKDSSKDSGNIFGYDSNNQLISATTPRGKELKIEYDNVKTDQVLSAVSSSGISNQVKYDSFGNPIQTKVIRKGKKEVVNGRYRIRSKGTEKYIKARYRDVVVESDLCSNTVWKVEKVNGKYRFIHDCLPSYNLILADKTLALMPVNENNLFTLKQNENRSYLIQISEKQYLRTNQNSLEIAEYIPNDPSFEFYFEVVEELFIEVDAIYSEDGRFVTSTTDSNFNTTEYETDSITGLVKSSTNAKGYKTEFTYNNKKQITSVKQGEKSVNYTYNAQNLISKIKQGEKEYNFIYDDFLNTKKVQIGSDITLVENSYEENNGNLSSVTYGNGHTISYDYDEFNRMKTLYKMDKNYHYRYDNNGNLSKILYDLPITTYDVVGPKPAMLYNPLIKFIYDTASRIIEFENGTFTINYTYDLNDNITSKKYKLYNVMDELSNTFDSDDLLTKTVIGNQIINYQYDELERLSKKSINNQYHSKIEYVSNGKRTTTLIKSITNNDNKYSYEYDSLNNITHVYYNDELERQYYYDTYNELIQEENYAKRERTVYSYDEFGNILTKTISNMDTEEIVKTDTYEYENSDWKDQLTKFNNQEITYDAIGNPKTIGENIAMDWTNGRSLASYTDEQKNRYLSYEYNQDGIRTKKTVNGDFIRYFLEGNQIIYEERTDDRGYLNMIYYLYDLTGIIGLKYNEDVYYYEKNLQGDIIGILDSSYNKVATYEYDAWGKVLSIKDNNGIEITSPEHIGIINPFRYRGYYYDNETELYYLNSRYYNPTWGRFLNADAYGGEIGGNILSHNPFVYVLNNPITYYDGFGEFALTLSALGAGALVVFGAIAAYPAVKAAVDSITPALSAVDRVLNYKPRELVEPKVKEKDKAIPYMPPSPNKIDEKPCTTATLSSGDVTRGKRLTIYESINHVQFGGNVMCDDVYSAKMVASGFPGFIGPEIDKNQKPGNSYYFHFHPDRYSHRHIWFYTK